MKVLSLFANIGVAEAYLSQIGVEVAVANELIDRRANLYSQIYPETQMICGDITNNTVYTDIINAAKQTDIDVIMATPPCQGISRAGKQHIVSLLLGQPIIQNRRIHSFSGTSHSIAVIKNTILYSCY